MYHIKHPRLVAPVAGAFCCLLVGLTTNPAVASGEATWKAVLTFAPTEVRTDLDAALQGPELSGRMQSVDVSSRLSADQLELSGTQDLAQLRTALFEEAADYADILDGPVAMTLTLPAGTQPVQIELESRPATGYVWEVISSGKGYVQDGPSDMAMRYSAPGAPAVQTIALQPLGKGGGVVQLVYKRPFESSEPIRAQVNVTLNRATSLIELTNPNPSLELAESPVGDTAVALASLPQAVSLPTSYDSRTLGIVPAVRNQGGCGSCWAFGTVGIMEIATKLGGGPLADFSEQFLVSCNNDGYSCNGGWFVSKYHYNTLAKAQTAIGVVLEADKPYTATNGSCTLAYNHPYKAKATQYVVGSGSIPTNDQIKTAIMTYGAVAVAVCADSGWSSYKSGVYSPTYNACGGVNHAVVLVGWNDATQTWLLRNSWGSGWGESGYMRIKYDPSGVNSRVGYAANWVSFQGISTYNLTVNSSGASAVAISASPTTYAGTTNYTKTGITSGTKITLTAPASTSTTVFTGWSGCDLASSTTCTVTMSAAKTVTANYVSVYTLAVNSSGASAVSIGASPSTYAGKTNYTKTGIISGTKITLTAPASTSTTVFKAWSGCDLASKTTCTVTMNAAKTVTASYTKK